MKHKVIVILLLSLSRLYSKTLYPQEPPEQSKDVDESNCEEDEETESKHEFVFDKTNTGKTTVRLLVGNPPAYIYNKYSQRGEKAYFRYTTLNHKFLTAFTLLQNLTFKFNSGHVFGSHFFGICSDYSYKFPSKIEECPSYPYGNKKKLKQTKKKK